MENIRIYKPLNEWNKREGNSLYSTEEKVEAIVKNGDVFYEEKNS